MEVCEWDSEMRRHSSTCEISTEGHSYHGFTMSNGLHMKGCYDHLHPTAVICGGVYTLTDEHIKQMRQKHKVDFMFPCSLCFY